MKRFLWGTRQDELLCENDNWMLGDHLNTIREVVDANGKTMAHYDYNAFGKCLSPLNDLSFAYTGKLTDTATGLQWNINRWYDANLGRWISEDPIGFEGKDENLYRYTKNLCINNIDVNGLEDCNLIIQLSHSTWNMHVYGFSASVSVGTNPGTAGFVPATSIYCRRSRTWSLGYSCPGTWFRCPAVISRTEIEYQWLSITIPSNQIILLGSVTIPIPSPLPAAGPGLGITLANFFDENETTNALAICNDTSISFPASIYAPPAVYRR